MKKSRRIFIVLLACVLAIGSVQFAGITALASESSSTKASTTSVQYNVLFEETFEAGYETKTSYEGKAGAWTVSQGDGLTFWQKESQIYPNKGKSGNADFAFSQPYQEQMVLKVTADISAGVISTSDYGQIDIVGLNDVYTANDDGRISICHLANGKIYTNCISATDSRDTGATYTAGQRMLVEATIDEANENCILSIYDKNTGEAILENYNIDPYKHDKSNYYKLTHGFTGIRFRAGRASNANSAYTLYEIKVEEVKEVEVVVPEKETVFVSLFEETFEAGYETKTSYEGKAGAWTVSQGDGLTFWQKESQIYPNKGKSGNADFAFSQPYQEEMVLKVTADISAGVISTSDYGQIDIVGLNDVYTANDDGRISICHLANGKIYTNCISATDSRDTGATYTAGQRMLVEATIDEANKICSLSIYDKNTGEAILENYNIDPYKHEKQNYYELTHGFTGIRFRAGRASNANSAYTLYEIKVEEVKEVEVVIPEKETVFVSLFEETFEADYETKTSYEGKAGAWKVPDGKFSRGGSGDMSEINVKRSTNSNVDFNFTEPYQEQMVLKVTADFLGGYVSTDDSMRIDIVGLNDVDTTHDSGRISVCYLVNGRIYANCMEAAAGRDTGATYTEGTRYVLEAIIDQANKTCTISVYEKATGKVVLENYNIDPYKHDKQNYYELTHGFTGIRFQSSRGNVDTAFDLYEIKVEEVKEVEVPVEPEEDPFNVSLFKETFESGFGNITSYEGKAGAWKNADSFMQSGVGEASEIHVTRNQDKNVDFNFTEPYQEAMVLKVTAEVVTGVADGNNSMRIDVVGLNDVDSTTDSGRESLCYLINGKIYANCMSATEARDTGATYTEGQKLIFEGIIDEVNKTFTLSVYDKETGEPILENYNVTPYKHDKANYYELTHGFTGIRFQTKRADVSQAFELYDISVMTIGEEIPEGIFAEITDVSVGGVAVNSLSQISTGDELTVTVDYTNSTGEGKTLFLIVACYDENCLTNFSYATKDVDGSVKAQEIEIDIDEINISGANKMKIMVWDGFITLGALSSIKTID